MAAFLLDENETLPASLILQKRIGSSSPKVVKKRMVLQQWRP